MKPEPLVQTSVGLLGLTGQGKADLAVLTSLVGPQKVNLTLKRSRLILAGSEPLVGGLLEVGADQICIDDQGLHHVLAVDRFEMSSIWKYANQKTLTTLYTLLETKT